MVARKLRPHIKTLKRRRSNSGQAISEYAMLLAFVAILVAIVFAIAPGKLGPAVFAAFSSMANQLNLLSDAISSSSGS